MSGVEVLGPKGPARFGGADMLAWARNQLDIASQIVDNPGGGLLFATQTIGQVKVVLGDADPGRWQAVIGLLEDAEDEAVRRGFVRARSLLNQAREQLERA